MDRRGFLMGLSGILAAGVAPAIITTPGLLMPVRTVKPLRLHDIEIIFDDFLAEKWYFVKHRTLSEEQLKAVMQRTWNARPCINYHIVTSAETHAIVDKYTSECGGRKALLA